MSAPGRPKRELLPLGGMARSAKGVPIRARDRLACCGILLLAACAEAPVQPVQPAPAATKGPARQAVDAAIADHRRKAQRHGEAGDHATAAREWQVVLLLAPDDDAARAQLEAARNAIRLGVRDNLQAGNAALKSGDTDRAAAAMLRVLALDPENADAAKVLRDIDRQKLSRIQGSRAARAGQAGPPAAGRAPAGSPATAESGDSYDLEQRLEMFRAGDLAGGLRELRAYVDANPRNEAARLRIAGIVYERSQEAEQKGAREEALMLCEQAASLRGKPVPEWTARAQALRKALSDQYFERGVQAYRTDVAAAIRLLETSVRYDPGNRRAQAKLQEARTAEDRLKRIEQDTKPR